MQLRVITIDLQQKIETLENRWHKTVICSDRKGVISWIINRKDCSIHLRCFDEVEIFMAIPKTTHDILWLP